MMPLAGVLMKKGVSARNLLALGLICVTYAEWLMSKFNIEAGFWAVVWPRVVLGAGIGLFFVPLAAATFAAISKEDTGNASGIFNLLRNIGGSFGIAISTTILARRSQLHHSFLIEHITPYNQTLQRYTERIQQWLAGHHPSLSFGHGPLALIYQEILRQSEMMAFNDTFWVLAWLTAALVPLTLLFRRRRDDQRTVGVH